MTNQDKIYDEIDKEVSKNEVRKSNVLTSALIIFSFISLICIAIFSTNRLVDYYNALKTKAGVAYEDSNPNSSLFGNDINLFEKIEVVIDDKVYDLSECSAKTVSAGVCKCNLKYKTGEEVTKEGYIAFSFKDKFIRIILPKGDM